MNIGEKIKFLRKERGISQQKLSTISEIPLRTIQEYEKGTFNPRQDKINKLAEAFQVPVLCFANYENSPALQRLYLSELAINERLIVLRVWNGYTIEYAAERLNEIENWDMTLAECVSGWETLEDGACSISWKKANALSDLFKIPVETFGWSETDPDNKYHPFSHDFVEKQYNKKMMNDESINMILSANEVLVVSNYRKLNSGGRNKLFDYAKDLSELERYTKPDPDDSDEE